MADPTEGFEVNRGLDVSSANRRVVGVIGDDALRADRNIDWEQDEDAGVRGSPNSRRSDRLGESGLLADAQGATISRRALRPMTATEAAAERAQRKLTADDWERVERERDERREAIGHHVAWAQQQGRPHGLWGLDDLLRPHITRAASVLEQVTPDPFTAAVGFVAQSQITKAVSVLTEAHSQDTTEFKKQALIALAGPAESLDPDDPNLVVLRGRREEAAAKRALSDIDFEIWRRRNNGYGSGEQHRQQLAAAGTVMSANTYNQHKRRAVRDVAAALRSEDGAVDLSARRFSPDEESEAIGS